MEKTLGIAVIGMGQRGMNCHARNFVEYGAGRVNMVGVCDSNPDNLAEARRRYPDARASADYREAIDQPEVDVAVVASPNFLHAEQATFALDRGKHTFCEKPLATTFPGCRSILDAARRSGKVLEVGFVMRYAALFAKLKELIAAGEIGEPLLFDWRVHYRGGLHYFRTWHRLKRYSGGLNVEKACHDYDVLNWCFGQLPKRVVMWSGLNKFLPEKARGRECAACPDPCEDYLLIARTVWTRNTPDGLADDGTASSHCFYSSTKDVGDHYVGLMEYESGLRGTVQLCFYPSSPYGRQFQFIGSRGEILGNAHDRIIELHRRAKGSRPVKFDLSAESQGKHYGGDQRQVEAFLRAVQENRESLATGLDGLRSVAVGLAMEKSIEEDRPVRLDEIMNPS
ncbi:MAG: Gfo/Idh/MocA family oxidoreductase [Candidatus Sumerlaeota bacterium]|nr:Gfo/Idh/MocA family oxidoreductase [Candidatus Sumerlaeota bacterium]